MRVELTDAMGFIERNISQYQDFSVIETYTLLDDMHDYFTNHENWIIVKVVSGGDFDMKMKDVETDLAFMKSEECTVEGFIKRGWSEETAKETARRTQDSAKRFERALKERKVRPLGVKSEGEKWV